MCGQDVLWSLFLLSPSISLDSPGQESGRSTLFHQTLFKRLGMTSLECQIVSHVTVCVSSLVFALKDYLFADFGFIT